MFEYQNFISSSSLDPEQKEELIQVIEKLLSDKTTLVVGSAVMAFEEVSRPYAYALMPLYSDYISRTPNIIKVSSHQLILKV